MRLGFPVSVLGRPRLKAHDGRRWQNGPHLSVSLLYLRDILLYLQEQDIHVYRMSSRLAPYISHPGLPQFWRQIEECFEELAFVGQLAQAGGVRLSFHASAYTTLSAPDEALTRKSQADLAAWAQLLDRMGVGADAVIVLHVGGAYGDPQVSKGRFVERCLALPEVVRRRLALENDDQTYSLAHVLDISRRTGLPVIFDHLHFLTYNPEGMSLDEALPAVRATWPTGVRPKLHFSSPRTEMKQASRHSPAFDSPNWTEHADFINPFEFVAFARGLPTPAQWDIMLEAKAKDLAVLRLRADLSRYAPGLAHKLE